MQVLLLICIVNSMCYKSFALSIHNASTSTINIAECDITYIENLESGDINNRAKATNKVDWTINPSITKKATVAFSLSANESVTINCTYSPPDASIDFGLISPDGRFYYINTKSGDFNKSIIVNENGLYYLAIRNNFSKPVNVVGFVYY